ncbi:30S ribosomal protein S2 [Candidatus Dojkabacteria bacterium]|nr:30S ribosomal protein S2 [Candidatus Dojkabacteria bacterium]
MSDIKAKKAAKEPSIKLPTVKELLEAGVHFGHETKRWDPEFGEFIYTKRENFHIINLERTLEKFEEALEFLAKTAQGGDILIVGTKRQARDVVKEEAVRCGAHFVINRWVGGLISNYDTVHKSIKKLQDLEEKLSGDIKKYSQQRLAVMRREWGRLDRLYQGIKKLNKVPDAVVIIDAKYEKIVVREARSVGLPIVALVDSNTSPRRIEYPIPANDDAIKSVELMVKYIAQAILAGNKGKGVRHVFRDYSHVGIKLDSESGNAQAEKEEAKSAKQEGTEEKEKKAESKVRKASKTRTEKKPRKKTSVKKESTKKAKAKK